MRRLERSRDSRRATITVHREQSNQRAANRYNGCGDKRRARLDRVARSRVPTRLRLKSLDTAMRALLKITVVLVLLGATVAATYNPVREYWKKRNLPNWRTATVKRGAIMSVVNSTGTVKPVQSVQVGSFVSGPILEVLVVFNERVKQGQLMARIDPRLFQSNVDRDRAVLGTRTAEVERVKALLKQAQNDERRANTLYAENPDYISQSEMDQFTYNRLALDAQLTLAKAGVEQATASLKNSQANLEYCEIRSPVAGIVIDRKIDPGQTLAASFQTPELFIVAPNMEEKMHVYASVDEADIGMIRQAKDEQRNVRFTVDAYPDDLFEGKIEEVRFSSTTNQNVVTYPVIVAAANPDLKLLPGMTASLSFEIDERSEAIKIPNSALRFYPDVKNVREEDRKLLDGAQQEDDDQEMDTILSATEKAEARKKRNRRHVWVADAEFLRAVEVVTGLNDSKFTELIEGDLKVDQKLVTGIQPKKGPF